MKFRFLILFSLFFLSFAAKADEEIDYATEDFVGMMNGWQMHFAYGNTGELAYVNGLMYGLSEGALFSLDLQDEEVRTVNALSGLSGSGIGHIIADDEHKRLLIAYRDGVFDVLYPDGHVGTITDLKRKQLSGASKLANDILCRGDLAYLACDFGVLIVNLKKLELGDWYQPVMSGNPMLQQIHIENDTLYALSATTLYAGCLNDNLVDFAAWKTWPAAQRSINIPGHICGHVRHNGCDYNSSVGNGIVRTCDGVRTSFLPNGPAVNSPYRMTLSDGRMIMVPGARWTSESAIPARVMIYEDGLWSNIQYEEIPLAPGLKYVFDFTRVAIDPQDKEHYFISSYGEGLYEFRGRKVVNIYNTDNSPLISASTSKNYCRVDGVAYDSEGYVWMLNSSNSHPLQVLSPNGQWASISLKGRVLDTPGDVLVDRFRPNLKWLISCRNEAGIGLVDDGGTPMQTNDDRVIFRSEFIDGDGKYVKPTEIYSIAQDRNGAVWVGTKEGLLMFPSSVDFFTSNRCKRIIIERTDDSGLGDYMLGTEQINGIAVDGGNRLWVATQTSGVYLMDVDLFGYGTKTVRHFTSKNSPMPSDVVLSVVVEPQSGEVFIGTNLGLVSFRSDATEPEDDFSFAYAYPNPVRPDYSGLLTVTGLMEDATVKITDSAGNLVYSATANGGTVVWNLRDASGRRVSPGVYVIFCNSDIDADPAGHKALKVLVM